MSASTTQSTLRDVSWDHPDDLDREDWQRVYDRCDGCLADVKRATGFSESCVRHRLVSHGIHEPADYKKRNWTFRKRLPHEVGLSPLDCGECGAEEIYDHPCPECGYDPGGDGDAE